MMKQKNINGRHSVTKQKQLFSKSVSPRLLIAHEQVKNKAQSHNLGRTQISHLWPNAWDS